MKGIDLKSLAENIDGELFNYDEDMEKVSGISIDSRKIKAGEIFIAIKGINMDGHDYVEDAVKNGARAIIVSRGLRTKVPKILVEDTSIALSKAAGYYRNMFDIPVIGVTGSTGKTSTKEMIASVLGQNYSIHKTQKNYNNEIGLPLTLFELDEKHELSILEMGMNNSGEIKRLANISRPSIGVITNIGSAHIENLGTKENILKAKMEITAFFNEKSILIVNGDDEYLSDINSEVFTVKKISIKDLGDYNAYDIINKGEHGVEFKCLYKGEVCAFEINVPGIHNVYNALYAIAIGEIFGLNRESLSKGIRGFKSVGERMNIITLEEGIKIISDCYNANPDSMKAGLDVLNAHSGKRKIAVLGDMYELGEFSTSAHRSIGNYLKDKCDVLIAVGEAAVYFWEEAKDKLESYYYKSKVEAGLYLNSILTEGDVVLIKASRGMKMEEITNYLLEDRKRVN